MSVPGFGLYRADGSPKPSAEAFTRVAGGSVVVEPDEAPEFKLGFLKWSQLEPWLLGDPLADEHGAGEGWTTQPTSTGRLQWVDGKGHAFVDHEGRLYRWQENLTESVEITP